MDPPWENKSVRRSGKYPMLYAKKLLQLPVPDLLRQAQICSIPQKPLKKAALPHQAPVLVSAMYALHLAYTALPNTGLEPVRTRLSGETGTCSSAASGLDKT